MFKFDFDLDDAQPPSQPNLPHSRPSSPPSPLTRVSPFTELVLDHLLAALPDIVSCAPLTVPVTSARTAIYLPRRDLFDARFQLISEGAGDADSAGTQATALAFVDAPSDLVPGEYEGGLKTWECSLDLVDYLDSLKDTPGHEGFVGKRILELGCGTAVPSMYVFRELLSVQAQSPQRATYIHLQDFNASVLELITFPNMLLTWYLSSASLPYRLASDAPPLAPSSPFDVIITPSLTTAFLSTLSEYNIALRFFSGPWQNFPLVSTVNAMSDAHPQSHRLYDTVLTSETIYCPSSLPSLVALLHDACAPKHLIHRHIRYDGWTQVGGGIILENESSGELDVTISSGNNQGIKGDEENAGNKDDDYLCLVAAKVLYFGVGGSITDFVAQIGKIARVDTVSEHKVGVGRKVLRIHWNLSK